jgi:hypothetical protein
LSTQNKQWRIHRPDTGSLGTQQAIKLRVERPDHLTGAIRRPRATTAATIEQIQHQSVRHEGVAGNATGIHAILLRQHAIGAEALGKQFSDCQTSTDPSRRPVRKVVTQPTQRYKGCLASRLQPADYDHCLDNYDDEQFQNIGLVPTALKQRVYDKGDIATRANSARDADTKD